MNSLALSRLYPQPRWILCVHMFWAYKASETKLAALILLEYGSHLMLCPLRSAYSPGGVIPNRISQDGDNVQGLRVETVKCSREVREV